MKVLVTGASGFLGSHLIDALINQGYQVKALVRKTVNPNLLNKPGLELCHGDITDKNILSCAVKDSIIVYHCAAKVSDWGSAKPFFKVNVEGTENLLKASLREKVERFVHVSSLTVLDISKNHWLSDEGHPYPEKYFESYTKTKVLAEKLVMRYYREEGLPVVIVRPSVIWGPGDTTILPRLISLLKSGKFFFIGKGNQKINLSYISNAVDALLLAGTGKKAVGQIYNIADDEQITFNGFIKELASLLNIDPPVKSIPFPLAYLIASFLELWAKAARSKTPPLLTRYGVYLASSQAVFDTSKAKNELGYQPRVSFEEGLQTTGHWLKKTIEQDNITSRRILA